ncbi:uncharacterized protein LOC115879750 isoform X1 [Sitophilus oryzae]|uniref:Uncharacterized protein LOC115879750 isoform X1 n=1 Tax=Sitophilus oryzae TaxID=7048 RepID=A0A6J2XML1_SITOR|nr:uncharacterized protein LOC115879750 isoform X1 [Sitophilus oryzae]
MKSKEILFVSIILVSIFMKVGSRENSRSLIRKRRYLAFPEGSAFSGVFCLTNLMKLPADTDIFSLNINWGIVYELPNDTKPLLDVYKPAMKRRNRRDLYTRVEKVLKSMGYDGKSCILRSLCEAGQRLRLKEDSLAYHILSLIFRFPQEPILKHEPDSHRLYHYASTLGSKDDSGVIDEYSEEIVDKCSETFKCPFSLIDLALGYYSSHPMNRPGYR